MNDTFRKTFNNFIGDIGTTNEINRIAWLEKTLLKIPPGGRILDAGAGTQRFRKFCSHLIYVSQDFAQYDGRGDQTGLQTGIFDYGKLDIISDISDIPEPDGSFDAILCTEVIEHVPSSELALREFSRLLKVGGHLVLTAPFCSLTHFAPYYYVTGFSHYYYEYFLKKYGFEITELEANGGFFDYLGQETRRIYDVAKQYTSLRLSFLDKIVIVLFLRMLRRLGFSDSRSSELVSFGFHVHAVKHN